MFKAKKWKQNNCLICFLSSCLLLTSSSFVSYANYNVDYSTLSRSKLGTAEADDIFNSCENEENIFLKNNYAPLYFKNLRTNFGNNVFNSCTYVAIGMLLSYYDSYWNDDIIPENFDKKSIFSSSLSSPQMDTESPGILFESDEDVKNLTGEEYLDFISQNKNTYFHLKLIDQGINFLKTNLNVNSLDFGVMPKMIPSLIDNYFNLLNSSTLNVEINYQGEANADTFTIEKLKEGKPVLIVARYGPVEDKKYHAMIACDYDENLNDIYVHTGWREESTGKTLSHISLDNFELNAIYYAVSLDFPNTLHRHSFNYRRLGDSDGGVCACTYISPRNVQIRNNYIDMAPTIYWDSIFKENWYSRDTYEVYFVLELVSNVSYTGEEREVHLSRTSYTLSISEWKNLQEKLKQRNYKIFVHAEHKKIGSGGTLGSLKAIEDRISALNLTIPTEYFRLPNIAPNEYNFPDAYSSSEIVAEHNLSNFSFTTRRLRAGYIHNEFIVLSPIRKGFDEAYIEYLFDTPIIQLDIELAHWRDFSTEQLDNTNGLAVLQEYKNGAWITKLDLLSDETNLTRDRNNPDFFSIKFNEPTSHIRIYAKTNITPSNNNNRGRICIGDVAFYDVENYMPTGDSELPFIPELWNDDSALQLNCYNYALNSKVGLHFLCNNVNLKLATPEELEDCLFDRASDYSYSILPIEKYEECPSGFYKIALVFDNDILHPDYHFYRQNADGTWSHKLGQSGIPTNLDGDGQVIYDPENCAQEYDIVYDDFGVQGSHNYSVFVGFYAVKTTTIIGGNRQ